MRNYSALLTSENATARIFRFCTSLISSQTYVDLRPVFQIVDDQKSGLVGAVIILPNCVDSSVRTTRSEKLWHSERMAKKDAAFQACIKLYKHGLLNNHLLPVMRRGQTENKFVEELEIRSSHIEVGDCLDPWKNIAPMWSAPELLIHYKMITIQRPSQKDLRLLMALPKAVPNIPPFPLYVDENTRYLVSISDHPLAALPEHLELDIMRRATFTILESAYFGRLKENLDFVALFLPTINYEALPEWLEANSGRVAVKELLDKGAAIPPGIVRDFSYYGVPHAFHRVVDDETAEVIPRRRRRDFLHNGFSKSSGTAFTPIVDEELDVPVFKVKSIPLESCAIEKLSLEYAECSTFVASITHRFWRCILALELKISILSKVGFNDIEYIITATNTPAANEPTNYEQLEFIGDSLLKYLASVNLFVNQPQWPEGFLSRGRDRIISNARLCRAVVESGLDRYIFAKPFTARRWRPAYISDYLGADSTSKRTLPTKTLADVAEALIGGAFMDGGISKAVKCAALLLPDQLSDKAPSELLSSGIPIPDHVIQSNQDIAQIEKIIGYEFQHKPLLLQAMVHPSFENGSTIGSYQRLEFLGDAVLDVIVIFYLTQHARHLPYHQMHLIKTAMVNTGYLAYLCMENSVDQLVRDIELLDSRRGSEYKELESTKKVRLCHFLRVGANIIPIREASLARFDAVQPQISAAIAQGSRYPWTELSSLVPEKFLADVIESIMGAIIIDAKGDLAACTRVADKFGMLKYLQRIIDEHVEIIHPKNLISEKVAATGRKVTYELEKSALAGYVTCKVMIDQEVVAIIADGKSEDEAMTRGASLALEFIKGLSTN